LHTARLRLRAFEDADANDLFALHSNAYVLRYWDAPPWSEPARAEKFIAACRQMALEGTGARLAVERVSDGAFVGWCSLNRWNPDFRTASLGYCYYEAAWGHGYATEAARALLRWAFDMLDLNRVQAETDTRNAASARVLEKLGFVREGTLREDCVVNGEAARDGGHRLVCVREQALGLERHARVDDLLDRLPGGRQAGAGEGLDAVPEEPGVVLGAPGRCIGAFELAAETGVHLAAGEGVLAPGRSRQPVDVQQHGGQLQLKDLG
jgi:RimJ/RimL family protein N-acetyltransferase